MLVLRKELIIVLVLFLIYAWQDLKSRSVSAALLMLGAAAGVLSAILNERQWTDILMALLPGIFLTGLSFVTEGSIGIGDGIAVLILGLFLENTVVFRLLGVVFFMVAVVSLGIITVHSPHRGRLPKESLPFLSFFPPAAGILLLLSLTG